MPDQQLVLQDNAILTMTWWQSASYTLELVKTDLQSPTLLVNS